MCNKIKATVAFSVFKSLFSCQCEADPPSTSRFGNFAFCFPEIAFSLQQRLVESEKTLREIFILVPIQCVREKNECLKKTKNCIASSIKMLTNHLL